MKRLSTPSFVRIAVAATIAAVPAACGSGVNTEGTSNAGGSAGTVCDPGLTRECLGPGACKGAQICQTSGMWGTCDCGSTNTGGAAGSSGSGGAGAVGGYGGAGAVGGYGGTGAIGGYGGTGAIGGYGGTGGAAGYGGTGAAGSGGSVVDSGLGGSAGGDSGVDASGGFAGSDSGAAFDHARDLCVAAINSLRAGAGIPATTIRKPDQEACADAAAQQYTVDQKVVLGVCSAWVTSVCPNWANTTPEAMIANCINQLWNDTTHPEMKANMIKYSQVACGFYVSPQGAVTAMPLLF